MKNLNLEQGSAEWHALRAKSIGASDCSAIMGNNPWKTEWQLFLEKKGLLEVKVTRAMEEGTRLEPIALAKFNHTKEASFQPCVCQNGERPWQIASLDGQMLIYGEIVEIKCSQKLYEQAKEGIIPQMYIDQIQHQLCVTHAEVAYYYAFWDGDGIEIEVKPDQEYIAKIIEKEAEFYRRMDECDPPPPDYRYRTDLDFVKKASIFAQKLSEQKMYEKMAKDIEKENSALKDELIAMAEGESTIGGGLRLCRVVKKGMIDYSACPVEIDWEQYRKPPIIYWRMTNE